MRIEFTRNIVGLAMARNEEVIFLLYFSMNYRDFSVKSKLIISLFQTVKLSLSISLFQKSEFREIVSFSC